jgi:hypothetical protein
VKPGRRTLPSDGTRVTAYRLAWEEVQANNRLEYPDVALPTYEGLEAQVTGQLRHAEVTIPFGTYTRYTVDGQDVDPDTIRPADDDRPRDTGATLSPPDPPAASPGTGSRRQLPAVNLDRAEESADWLKVYDPVELGVPPGTEPLEAARMLNLDPDLMVFRQRRQPDGSIRRLPRGWWQGVREDPPSG